jgi:hypothetical protein
MHRGNPALRDPGLQRAEVTEKFRNSAQLFKPTERLTNR